MSSSLIIEVCKIGNIRPHPNADKLEIATVKGWQTIVQKGQFQEGDLIIYIPVDSVIPHQLADKWNVKNYLGGSNKDRVRCARLRGEMSFGFVIKNEEGWEEGTNVSEHYGITKYIPPVRPHAGDAAPDDPLFDRYTDIENMRNFPDVIHDGEEVVITEKINGSCNRIGIEILDDENIQFKAGSHKIKRKMPPVEEMENNTYWFAYLQPNVRALLNYIAVAEQFKDVKTATLFGEVYGKVRGGHKSMHYGKPNTLNFVAFDLQVNGKYLDYFKFKELTEMFCVPTVPVLSIEPFCMESAKKHSQGDSILASLNGDNHMREGCVIRPVRERIDPQIGRVILKFLNDDYLVLKGKGEDKGEITDFTDE